MKELKRTIKIKDDEIYQLRNQLGDKKLHENEFGFDMLCEKYVDDCAIKILQTMMSSNHYEKLSLESAIEKSYSIAELMLKEKLKRKK